MTKQITSKLAETLRMTAAVLLMLLLGAIYPAAVSDVNAQTPSKATTSSQGGGPKEGIKVHGHWTIEVRNADGSLAVRREFENAFDNPLILSNFLARRNTPGQWIVILSGNACSGGPIAFPTACIMDQSGGTYTGAFPTLTVDITQHPGAPIGLLLHGQATAANNGMITGVQTKVTLCGPDVAPASCSGSGGGAQFTSATLVPPVDGVCPPNTRCTVSVVAGQIIQVTVTISFS